MELCGSRISLDSICSAAAGEGASLCEASLKSLQEARRAYLNAALSGKVYGYSTGLGGLIDVEQAPGAEREHKILIEHDLAVGPEAPRELVRATIFVRLSQLSRGVAPVRPEVAQRLAEALSFDIVPAVPLHGSVGASGDLEPLARIARCLYYGEGEALLRGSRTTCSSALREAGIEPMELEPGEALAIINSDAWSVAIASLGICLALRLINESLRTVGETLRVTGCNPQHFSEAVAAVKGHRGISEVLKALNAKCERTPRMQDPYSIRCVPIIYGAALELLEFSKDIVETEASGGSENPFVYSGQVIHACNFHAAYASVAADAAKVAIAHVANSIERRAAHLLSSATTGLPEFLRAGDSAVGAMIYQYAAASLTSSIREAAHVLGVSSLPTSGLQEDVVSMAPVAGLELIRADGFLARLIAIELSLARQAERASRGEALEDPRQAVESALSEVLAKVAQGLEGLLRAAGGT